MAKNLVLDFGLSMIMSVAVTDPTAPNSGDPVRYGIMTGVAQTKKGDGQDVATETSVDFGTYVVTVPVKAKNAGITAPAAVFYDDSLHGLSDDPTGYFFGFALQNVVNGQTTTIKVMHFTSPGSGSLSAGAIATAALANGAVTQAKILPNSLDGTVVKLSANADVLGEIKMVHRIDLVAGANADVTVTLTNKERVIDVYMLLSGAGVASETVQVKNGTNAITEAMAASGSVKAIVRATTIDPTYWEIAAGGSLVIHPTAGASQPNATVFVETVPVA